MDLVCDPPETFLSCYNREVDSELDRIEAALSRYGLLLEHDQELPSVTLLIAGEPIRGSWWGHRLGHAIYELLGVFHQRSGALSTKIVDGKVTYVHPRLWPAFMSLAQDSDPGRRQGLSPAALELLACVEREGPLRADAAAMPRALAQAPRELTKTIRLLETRLLLHSDSLHTESGAHVKVLRSWPQWCQERGVCVEAIDLAEARAELQRALDALCAGTTRRPKVPW